MKELTLLEQKIMAVILSLDGKAYGVSIRRKVEGLGGGNLMYGTLYKALGQLHRKGCVTQIQGAVTSSRGGRPRIYYTLTESGKKALRASFDMQKAIWRMVPHLICD